MKVSRKQLLTLVILYLVGFVFLAFTDPRNLPLPLLILPFIYVFITIFLTTKLLITSLARNRGLGISVGLTVTIFIVLTLILASIRQLSSRDVLISLALTVILSWYLVKSRVF